MRESGIKSKSEGCGETEILQRNGEEGRGREGRRGKAAAENGRQGGRTAGRMEYETGWEAIKKERREKMEGKIE